jgi:uncharacterized repeat protein (TIGR04138 family)
MPIFHAGLMEVVQRDPRYAYEAYEFLFHALQHTQKQLGREPPENVEGDAALDKRHHVSGRELLIGIRDLARREFGLMARTVFQQWGVHQTDDFGNMVFNLVKANLLSKTDEDTITDFHAVYDLDKELLQDYQIPLDEATDA